MMALMDDISKPNRAPPMTAMAAMKYGFPICFTILAVAVALDIEASLGVGEY